MVTYLQKSLEGKNRIHSVRGKRDLAARESISSEVASGGVKGSKSVNPIKQSFRQEPMISKVLLMSSATTMKDNAHLSFCWQVRLHSVRNRAQTASLSAVRCRVEEWRSEGVGH